MNNSFSFKIDKSISPEIQLIASGEWLFTDQDYARAIFGPSGCGKTSLLKILLGVDQQANCQIRYRDEIWQNSKSQVYVPTFKRRLGYAPQKECLFPFLNVTQNILYSIEHLSEDENKLRLKELLELFEITDLANRKISEISGGQRQRVSLARALAHQPQILFLDEAFASLDLKSRKTLLPNLASWLRKHQIRSLLVSHDEKDADLFSARISQFDANRFHL